MGSGFCLWFDFSFSLEFRLLLALLTLYPHPTFAPSSGEPSQIVITDTVSNLGPMDLVCPSVGTSYLQGLLFRYCVAYKRSPYPGDIFSRFLPHYSWAT